MAAQPKINKVCCWKFFQHCLRNQNTRSSIHDFHTNWEHWIFLSSVNSKKLGCRNYIYIYISLSFSIIFFARLRPVQTMSRFCLNVICQNASCSSWSSDIATTFNDGTQSNYQYLPIKYDPNLSHSPSQRSKYFFWILTEYVLAIARLGMISYV